MAKGDVLFMREDEWASACKSDTHKDFTCLDEIKELDKADIMPQSVPSNTGFDLRTIKWNSGQLTRHLNRFNKTKLLRIATAMKAVGLPIEVPDRRMQFVDIVDLIHHTAAVNGWAKLTREEILTCGVWKPRTKRKRKAKAKEDDEH